MQAVRDGVIEASIDHERGFMRSKVHMNIVGPPPCAVAITVPKHMQAYTDDHWNVYHHVL